MIGKKKSVNRYLLSKYNQSILTRDNSEVAKMTGKFLMVLIALALVAAAFADVKKLDIEASPGHHHGHHHGHHGGQRAGEGKWGYGWDGNYDFGYKFNAGWGHH